MRTEEKQKGFYCNVRKTFYYYYYKSIMTQDIVICIFKILNVFWNHNTTCETNI